MKSPKVLMISEKCEERIQKMVRFLDYTYYWHEAKARRERDNVVLTDKNATFYAKNYTKRTKKVK